jgi:hypothetical protein
LLFSACVPASEFGNAWPSGVPVQVHGMDADEFFVTEGDLDAARELVSSVEHAELSCTQAISTCSPTTACPPTTKRRPACLPNA